MDLPPTSYFQRASAEEVASELKNSSGTICALLPRTGTGEDDHVFHLFLKHAIGCLSTIRPGVIGPRLIGRMFRIG